MAGHGEGLSVADAKKVINDVVSILQDNNERIKFGGVLSSLNISEVFKGGSMGKGTMIQGDFDVDLVIYTTSIDLHSATRIRGYEEYFRAIHSYLNTRLRGYELKNYSNLSLQFTCSGTVSVDILLSPYFKDFGEYCNLLEIIDRTQLSLFSCSASRWQVEFVQSYPMVVDYIKKVKAWRNMMWDDQGRIDGRPKSYLIELLVIKAYEDCMQSSRQMSSFTTIVGATPFRATVSDGAMKQQLIKLVTDPRIAVYWTHYYTEDKIWRFNDRRPPFIIDPANPSNNVYITGIVKQGAYGRGWETFRSMIYTLQI